MRIAVQHLSPAVVWIAVGGEIDMATAPEFGAALRAELTAVPRSVRLDLAGATSFSAAGLEALRLAQALASEIGVTFEVHCASAAVRRAAVAAGLHDQLGLAASPQSVTTQQNRTDLPPLDGAGDRVPLLERPTAASRPTRP